MLKENMGNEENMEDEEKDLTTHPKDGVEIMYNIASFYSSKYFNDLEVKEVRVRVLRESPVPFTEWKNNSYEREKRYTTYDWKDIEIFNMGGNNNGYFDE